MCLSSAQAISDLVDFEILGGQFEKYGITEANLLGALRHMKDTIMPMGEKMVHIWELLESLDEIENGFQIFYRCLRETQDGCSQHAIVVNYLERTSKSYL